MVTQENVRSGGVVSAICLRQLFISRHLQTENLCWKKADNIFLLCQELDVVAPAYDHFTAKLNQMKNMRVEYLYTSFKQFFCYERSKDMVLMKITNQ